MPTSPYDDVVRLLEPPSRLYLPRPGIIGSFFRPFEIEREREARWYDHREVEVEGEVIERGEKYRLLGVDNDREKKEREKKKKKQ